VVISLNITGNSQMSIMMALEESRNHSISRLCPIMQAILLIKQSINSNQILYNGDLVTLGSFETVSFGGTAKNIIKIDIEFVLNSSNVFKLNDFFSTKFKQDAPLLKDLNIQSIHYCLEFGKEILIETVSDSGGMIMSRFEHRNSSYTHRVFFPILFAPGAPSKSFGGNGILNWQFAAPNDDIALVFAGVLMNILLDEFNKIYFISTDRGINERVQSLLELRHISAGVGIRGEKTISVIHHLRTNDLPPFDEIVREASKFGIKLTTRINGSFTSVIFKDDILPFEINVIDAGYGLNQILPIIVQSYIAGEGSTILIEEPETHLHEGAQYKLLDMFLDVVGKGKQIIITSHSVALRSRTIRYFLENCKKQNHPDIEQVQYYFIKLESSGSLIVPEPLETMNIVEGRQYMSQEDYNGVPRDT
jgi:hypothetical protein